MMRNTVTQSPTERAKTPLTEQVSIQTRCPQMGIHPPFSGPDSVPFPCPDCYSIEVRSRVLPQWVPDVRWHEA